MIFDFGISIFDSSGTGIRKRSAVLFKEGCFHL